MAKLPNLSEEFPTHVAGVRSMRCKQCADWELTFIVPEEFDLALMAMFHHLEHTHGISLPTFMVSQY